jgi:hypothetical protein
VTPGPSCKGDTLRPRASSAWWADSACQRSAPWVTLSGYYIAYAIGLLRRRRRIALAGPAFASERHGV